MYKVLVIFTSLMFIFTQVLAQNANSDDAWQAGANNFEYNCETLKGLLAALDKNDALALADLGEAAIVRTKAGDETTVNAYIGTLVLHSLSVNDEISIKADDLLNLASTACSEDTTTAATDTHTSTSVDPFPVVVNGDANLRSCAGTNCDVVQVAKNGSLLTVVGTDSDWYEVQLDDGTTAFIATRLTTTGPDAVIKVDEPYLDAKTGCGIAFDVKRGDADINLILTGEKRSDLVVDLYRPNESHPLRVEGQLDKTFIDTGDPYIYQYYRYNVSWPTGVYQLELTINGETSKLAWELETRGDYSIYVVCN
ncbi:MAG: SH3 domain-containing protein [Chloroflexota bacterium]